MEHRPWGNAPKEERPGPLENLFGGDKAREKEEKWKAFEANKKKIRDEIRDFEFDSDRIRYRFTNKFQDGLEDVKIPERLADLWWHHNRYKKHSGPEYVERRNAAFEAFKDITPSSAWTNDSWGDYYDKERDLVREFPDPDTIKPLTPGKIELAHRLLERAWAWDKTTPYGKALWRDLIIEFRNYFGSSDELSVFKEDIDKLVAEMKAKRAEEKGTVDVRASVVDAVFEAHALKGRRMRV